MMNVSLLMSVIALLMTQNWRVSLLLITQFFLLGSCAAHWLLVKARSRLQAFHRILPMLGVTGAIFMAITLAIVANRETDTVNELVQPLLVTLGLMLLGVTTWVLPSIRKQAIKLWQLNLVLLLEISACVVGLNFV